MQTHLGNSYKIDLRTQSEGIVAYMIAICGRQDVLAKLRHRKLEYLLFSRISNSGIINSIKLPFKIYITKIQLPSKILQQQSKTYSGRGKS